MRRAGVMFARSAQTYGESANQLIIDLIQFIWYYLIMFKRTPSTTDFEPGYNDYSPRERRQARRVANYVMRRVDANAERSFMYPPSRISKLLQSDILPAASKLLANEGVGIHVYQPNLYGPQQSDAIKISALQLEVLAQETDAQLSVTEPVSSANSLEQ